MGWCHEFGPQIRPGCDQPMTAAATECHCAACGTRCEGRFGGCAEVWSRGATRPAFVAPRPAPPTAATSATPSTAEPAPARANGPREDGAPGAEAVAPVPVVPPRPVHPTPSEDILRGVVSALETVGAELRAMRATVDRVRSTLDAPPVREAPPVRDAPASPDLAS